MEHYARPGSCLYESQEIVLAEFSTLSSTDYAQVQLQDIYKLVTIPEVENSAQVYPGSLSVSMARPIKNDL